MMNDKGLLQSETEETENLPPWNNEKGVEKRYLPGTMVICLFFGPAINHSTPGAETPSLPI